LFTLKQARTKTAAFVEKAHGRIEKRTIELALGLEGHRPVPEFLDWPRLAQAFKMTRQVQRGAKTSVETSYAITSLTACQLNIKQAAKLWRGHWSIENKLHYVRDVTFDEDRSQVRTRSAPQAMAACRNAVIALLRLQGCKNIAAAIRTYAAIPMQAALLVKGAH
jgi:predicted transposase YbfD/YdcC